MFEVATFSWPGPVAVECVLPLRPNIPSPLGSWYRSTICKERSVVSHYDRSVRKQYHDIPLTLVYKCPHLRMTAAPFHTIEVREYCISLISVKAVRIQEWR